MISKTRLFGALVLLVLAAALVPGRPAQARPEGLPEVGEYETNYRPIGRRQQTLVETHSMSSWVQKVPLAQAWNQSAAEAYVKRTDSGVRLEAMTQCDPGVSSRRADAKVTYRWTGTYTGPTGVRPRGAIWGQLIGYPGVTGSGSADAKITFTVHDLTDDVDVIDTEVYKDSSPSFVGDVIPKGKTMENRETGRMLSPFQWFGMIAGHDYEATVKLWVSCWSKGLYGARADFSRHTVSNKDSPLIGMVTVRQLDFSVEE